MKKQAHPIWIPPYTTKKGAFLVSLGNGSNVEWKSMNEVASLVGGSSGLPTATTDGEIAFWNGSAWVVSSVSGVGSGTLFESGSLMVWDGTKWNITQGASGLSAGDVLTWQGTYWAPQAGGTNATEIQGTPISLSSLSNGSMLYYTPSGSGYIWTNTIAPNTAGQQYFWNGYNWTSTNSPFDTGSILFWNSSANTYESTPAPGSSSGYLYWTGSAYTYNTPATGALNNAGWQVPSIPTAAINVSTSSTNIQTLTVSGGYNNYLVNFSFGQTSTAATGAGTMEAILSDGASLSVTIPLGGFTTTSRNNYASSYFFNRSSTGSFTIALNGITTANTVTVSFGNISVVGIS